MLRRVVLGAVQDVHNGLGFGVLAVEASGWLALVEASLLHEEAVTFGREFAAAVPAVFRSVSVEKLVRGLDFAMLAACGIFPRVAFGELCIFCTNKAAHRRGKWSGWHHERCVTGRGCLALAPRTGHWFTQHCICKHT